MSRDSLFRIFLFCCVGLWGCTENDPPPKQTSQVIKANEKARKEKVKKAIKMHTIRSLGTGKWHP